jgi:hypothetical protein
VLEPAAALQFADELRLMRDPELLLLKGHVLVQRFLVAVVAARLNCGETAVPGLKFGVLTQLAFDESEERNPFLWLNDLRNSVAHQFQSLESRNFAEVISRFRLPWPGGALERCILLEQILVRAISVALGRMLSFVADRPAPPGEDLDMDEFETLQGVLAGIKKRIEQIEENLSKMRAGDWDELVTSLRPGWRQRS